MKTNIWVCDKCSVPRFHNRGFYVDETAKDARRSELNSGKERDGTEYTGYGYTCLLMHDGEVCGGVVEYYAYSDFDRYK